VAKDHLGHHLGETTIPTTSRGYRELLAWAESHGEVEAWGVEGTGSYGAGLSRFLAGADQVGHQRTQGFGDQRTRRAA